MARNRRYESKGWPCPSVVGLGLHVLHPATRDRRGCTGSWCGRVKKKWFQDTSTRSEGLVCCESVLHHEFDDTQTDFAILVAGLYLFLSLLLRMSLRRYCWMGVAVPCLGVMDDDMIPCTSPRFGF